MPHKPNTTLFYGEDKTPDYAIVNANFGYKFTFEKSK